jgi:hypothetical protein
VTFSLTVAAFIRDPKDSKVLPWEFTHLKETFFNIRLRGQIIHRKGQNYLPWQCVFWYSMAKSIYTVTVRPWSEAFTF